jgi:hypothetical protein
MFLFQAFKTAAFICSEVSTEITVAPIVAWTVPFPKTTVTFAPAARARETRAIPIFPVHVVLPAAQPDSLFGECPKAG